MFIAIALFPQRAELLSDILKISVVVVTLETLVVSQRLRFLYIAVASVAFALDVLYGLAANLDLPIQTPAQFILATIWMLFFGLSIILLTQSLFGTQNVTLDTVIGGVCIFLMLGYFWFLIFAMIALVNPNAFAGPEGIPSSFDLIYFSFVTLTSLGFGEFTPVSRMAKVASNLAAICGVLYPAIFIARLVNDYQHQPDK